MTLGLLLYRTASSFLGLFSGFLLKGRVHAGKEDVARLNERRARDLMRRPPGTLIWLHGASVGESLMLLELGVRLQDACPDLQLLFTSQTQTSARLLIERLPENARHQMAPLDTPAAARRFVSHWQPDLVIIAEGEIWPNLLSEVARSDARLTLINARMAEKSLRNWARWPRTARSVFGQFDLIMAADERTAAGLTPYSASDVHRTGNLKSALSPPKSDELELKQIESSFIGSRSCFIGASTHPGEEALLIEACAQIDPAPALILAPRHPERGDEIEALIRSRGLTMSRRSRAEPVTMTTDVLLADTLGEMGLWYRLADAIYLGGAHETGIGGHNPIEPLKLKKPVITGPYVSNFTETFEQLVDSGAAVFAATADGLAACFEARSPLSEAAYEALLACAEAPMTATLEQLLLLLPAPGDST